MTVKNDKIGGSYGFVRVTMGHVPALLVGLAEAMVPVDATLLCHFI
jgi:hypothetical protein